MLIKGYKSVIFLLMSLMLLFGVTACGSDTTSKEQETPVVAAEPVKQEPEVIVEECDEAQVLSEKAVGYFNSLPENSNMMSAEKFKEQFDMARDSVFVLDIRKPEDFTKGHLEGAVNIPMKEIGNRIAELPANSEIAVICYSGQTAAQTAGVLKMAGFNTKIITGGFKAIEAAGFELVN